MKKCGLECVMRVVKSKTKNVRDDVYCDMIVVMHWIDVMHDCNGSDFS